MKVFERESVALIKIQHSMHFPCWLGKNMGMLAQRWVKSTQLNVKSDIIFQADFAVYWNSSLSFKGI